MVPGPQEFLTSECCACACEPVLPVRSSQPGGFLARKVALPLSNARAALRRSCPSLAVTELVELRCFSLLGSPHPYTAQRSEVSRMEIFDTVMI